MECEAHNVGRLRNDQQGKSVARRIDYQSRTKFDRASNIDQPHQFGLPRMTPAGNRRHHRSVKSWTDIVQGPRIQGFLWTNSDRASNNGHGYDE